MSYFFAFLSVLLLIVLRGYMLWLQSCEARKLVPVKLRVRGSAMKRGGGR